MRIWMSYFRYTPEIIAFVATCVVLAK